MLHYANLSFILYSIIKLLTYNTPFYVFNSRWVINAEAGPVFWPTLYIQFAMTVSRPNNYELFHRIAVSPILFTVSVIFLKVARKRTRCAWHSVWRRIVL